MNGLLTKVAEWSQWSVQLVGLFHQFLSLKQRNRGPFTKKTKTNGYFVATANRFDTENKHVHIVYL